nr:class I SAM-dependent methyltransferase family protein [Methanobrevibacter arboriphilus]
MLTIKVPLKHIEEVREILMETEIISRNYKILTEGNFGYIPINKKISNVKLKENIEKELKKSTKEKIHFEIVDKNLKEVKKKPRSLTEHLKGKLTEKEIEDLKTSFDIIGDTVILEIPEDLENQKNVIGDAALAFTGRKSVFMKKSAVEGVTRTRKLELIAGEDIYETIHKEHGVRLKLDVKKVYFSPRLATERKRLAKQVKDGEIILDMFAGIGPFPILIAKKHEVDIYATDINKEAIKYMENNIEINKLKGKIRPILGDVKKIAEEKFIKENIRFDRIIMNLPGTAKDFLELAMTLVNNEGIIHYYEFSDGYESAIKRIEKIAKKQNKNFKILNTRKVKSSSPKEWHIVVDAQIQ